MKFSNALKSLLADGGLDAIEGTFDGGAEFRIFDGAMPTDCEDSDVGVEIFNITLPTDFFATPSGGTMEGSVPFSGAALADGEALYFRVYSTSTVCLCQGTCGLSGTDLVLDVVDFLTAAELEVTQFDVTAVVTP